MDEMDEEWQQALRGGELRATGDALGRIAAEVRRRRHRRRGIAVGIVAGAAAITVALPIVLRSDDRSTDATDPVATPTAADPASFTCATESRVFGPGPAPAPSYVTDRQADSQRILNEIEGIDFGDVDGFTIRRAEARPIGVVALVTGDAAMAEQVLVQDYGVSAVHAWDPGGPSVGLDEDAQLDQIVQWALDPVLREARRRTRGIAGSAGLAYWTSEAAILVQWRRPAPAEVLALEDIRFKTGGWIVVEEVTYSSRDVRRATDRVLKALRAGETVVEWDEWSSSYGCQDGEGLVVGIVPEALEDRRPELQEQLAAIAGMPVMVVPEERPVPLSNP